jgi:hypothetical protein
VEWLGASVLALGLAALAVSAARARAICVLSVRQGRVLIMRGSLPSSALTALVDVFERSRVQRASVRVLRDGGRPRLDASGLDANTLQRARNVIGTFPLPRLLAAPRVRRRNLGQWLGIAWLGWLLHERR